MLVYVARRIVYVIPIVISVALVCFLLVHITPGDPLVAILPADGNVDEPDLDLAQRIAAETGTSLTILGADALERLRHALR